MKVLNLSLIAMLFLMIVPAYAGETSFSGQTVGTVNEETYEALTMYIYGDTAKAMFTSTAALSRIEPISDLMRRVVGQNLTCFEKFPEAGSSEAILYTCKFIVQQGGKIVRAPIQ